VRAVLLSIEPPKTGIKAKKKKNVGRRKYVWIWSLIWTWTTPHDTHSDGRTWAR